MATYYPTSSNHQGDVFQSSADTSFLELLSGNIQPNSQILSQVEDSNSLDDEHDLNYQELSLSLGTQLSSSSMAFQYNYLNSHLPNSSDQNSQINKEENRQNTEYMSFNLVGTPKNGQCSISDTYNGSYGVVGRILDLKYLKPSQELLEEVANLRQLKMNRHKLRPINENDSKFTPVESTTNSSGELLAPEKQDSQNKVTKLFSLLDEVDRKYREYCQQLQIVEAGLDVVSGCGAARPYTALAYQTISRHFRCLHDAINDQIQVSRKTLGDQDGSLDRVLPRLRNVERQIRQQRNLHHHISGAHHSWRLQRGLPETSVSVLRAWLFEHFLNPYPKDSEKMMLAKQTGLTRGQIANWFINARVRLWKPMIEDIYKEEFSDEQGNSISISSQENTPKSLNDNSSSSEDKEKESPPMEANPDFFNQMEASRFEFV